ncbi:hypothetical protein PCASD_17533 [Puccinia coronata f. sp. avenae]|uniref:Uncharacterized protein n=1 Tax=Puccinia coronata f. sp. avenae TaxID=200324 RepID=A0A2N5U3W7_9BASI|nr:hypothetical protein PCASD_17533 [Puccinia coronata f. sp. avenae]
MFSSPSNLIIQFSILSAHVLGMAIPRSSSTLQSITSELSALIIAQDQAIAYVQNLLDHQNEVSGEQISSLCSELIESYYRQMEPRQRMVDMAPTDTVLDSNSLEYLVAVGSRYASNVLHLARQIREDPLDLDSSLAFKELKKEHEKSHMFDELLLGLAEVYQKGESEKDSIEDEMPSDTMQQTVLKDAEAEVAIQNPSQEAGKFSSMSVTVEEEIETTTTETIVTSYTKKIVEW